MRAVNATWLHRLQHAVVFTSERLGDERIPYRAVFNGFDDSYEKVFNKAKFGFYYAYMNISQKFDWYIRLVLEFREEFGFFELEGSLLIWLF